MLKPLLFLSFLTLVVACKSGEPTPNENNPNLYGAELSDGPVLSVSDLLTQLESADAVENIKIEATVDAVCQSKGCWMNVSSEGAPEKPIFVKFKDYGFFVPKDLAGSRVIMEGRAYKEETSVDELRHYAEDEGKSAEEIAAITEPVQELKFMATGVEILK